MSVNREDILKMDKPKEGKTITIKINGKESPFLEKTTKEKVEKKVESKEKKSLSTNPIGLEAAAAKEHLDESDNFEWILPNPANTSVEECNTDSDPNKMAKKAKTFKSIGSGMKINKHSLKKMNLSMFFAVFFAVLLGTFFGLMLLKIVPAEKVVENEQPVINPEEQNQPANENNQSGETLSATRPSISTVVIQEGIYSTKEAANKIKDEMNDKEIPAEVFATDQQFALFVGISNNVEDAKLVGNRLKSDGVNTYSKQWTIEEKSITNLSAEEKKLLELSPQIFQSFIAGVSSADGTNKVPQDLMENVNKQQAGLDQIKKDKLQNKNMIQLYSQLEAAAAQLKVYDQKPKSSTLNMVQQHLLTFLANYQSL